VACFACAHARLFYLFALFFFKCSKCTQKDVFYNGNFFKTDYNKLSAKQAKLEAARFKAILETAWLMAKSVSLDRQMESLKRAKKEIIA
jgi:hypothetical protein